MKKRKIKLFLPQIKLRTLSRIFAKRRSLLLKVIIFVFIFFIIGLIIIHLEKFLKRSDYFKIKDIIVNDNKPDSFFYLKGNNIFNIDLKRESRYISQSYPAYKKIRLIRVLPNRLFIDFIRRQPFAYIKLYRYFCIDEDQVLFNLPGQLKETDLSRTYAQVRDKSQSYMNGLDLPIILGLETKIFGPKVGKKYEARELTVALNIIKELSRDRRLRDYKLKTVDVSNFANLSFSLRGGPKVKIGQYNINNKIKILSRLFPQIKEDLSNIKYIDLRFRKPVIKFK